MRKRYLILLAVLVLASCNRQVQINYTSKGRATYDLTAGEEAMIDSIQQKTFQFFLHEHHPEWGIVK